MKLSQNGVDFCFAFDGTKLAISFFEFINFGAEIAQNGGLTTPPSRLRSKKRDKTCKSTPTHWVGGMANGTPSDPAGQGRHGVRLTATPGGYSALAWNAARQTSIKRATSGIKPRATRRKYNYITINIKR